MKNTNKGPKTGGKAGQEVARKDRKSATGVNGSPKKGGHGGKFTWSGDGYSEAELGWSPKEGVMKKDVDFEDLEA